MPTHFRPGSAPVVQFDPRIETSPFALFRRLRDGRSPLLIDVRPLPGGKTLEGATRPPAADWRPPDDVDVVLFDDDGSAAVATAARWQEEGHERVRALFGGLDLYEFALDPQVVGEETFLRWAARPTR